MYNDWAPTLRMRCSPRCFHDRLQIYKKAEMAQKDGLFLFDKKWSEMSGQSCLIGWGQLRKSSGFSLKNRDDLFFLGIVG